MRNVSRLGRQLGQNFDSFPQVMHRDTSRRSGAKAEEERPTPSAALTALGTFLTWRDVFSGSAVGCKADLTGAFNPRFPSPRPKPPSLFGRSDNLAMFWPIYCQSWTRIDLA
jgi:hypothetical protein